MEITYQPRRSGKTEQLLQRASKCNGYIVCMHANECSRMFRLAQKLNIDINFPITFSELLNKKLYHRGVRKVHIDNADAFIEHVSAGLDVQTITLTKKDGDN